METLQSSLQRFMKDRNLDEKVNDQFDQLFEHPSLKQWWADHPDLSKDALLPFVIKIKEYVQEQDHCTGCQGLSECKNLMKGHSAQLIRYGNMLDVTYRPCAYQKQAEREKQRERLIKSHHIPHDILKADFTHFAQDDPERVRVIKAVWKFCTQAQPGVDGHGLYIYGPLGVGKSYLMGAACNQLAERNIDTYMVYVPEFFREVKAAIADQSVNQKVEALQTVPVLILDDIGAETISSWIRDEVLGPILQYRMMEKLPTLYTSNYDYDQLEDHLMHTHKGQVELVEEMKAKRIMERIKHYTDDYIFNGYNRREKSL